MDAQRPPGERPDQERPGTPMSSPPPAVERSPRLGAVRVLRLGGIPVYLTTSWIVLSVVLIFGYGALLGRRDAGPAGYLLGASVVVCLIATVLLHEIGHAVAARRYRVKVRGITLELLGGFTELEGEVPTPRAEAVIALAGPAVSVVLAVAGGALLPVTDRGTVLGDLVFQIAVTNTLVAAFNILPGLPLDGGRALRAGVWRITHDPYRADVVAGWSGRIIALATLVTGIVLYRNVRWITVLGMIFVVIIAFTLWNGATESIRTAGVRARLPYLRAGTMARPLHLVATGTPLAEALRQRDERVAAIESRVPVVLGVSNSAGRVIGLVNGREVAAVPPERRPWVDVDAVARPIAAGQWIAAAATGTDVLARLQANPDTDLLVTVGEDVVGVLRVLDVMTMLESGEPPS
jgi:Zn-dependent protease